MNLRSYDKTTRLLKQADWAAMGLTTSGDNNVLVIGVIDCTQNHHEDLIENLTFGIRQNEALPLKFSIANFSYLQRITPATAKFTPNYIDFVAKSTAALVRSNLLDCVVAVVDNYVMGLGVLQGCTTTNCPVILMPAGVNLDDQGLLFQAPGKIATRKIKSTEIDEVIESYQRQTGNADTDTISTDFFRLVENFGLCLPGAATTAVHHARTLQCALATGIEAVKRADDIITTKRLINKRTLNESLENYTNQFGRVNGLLLFQNLFNALDVKIPNNVFPVIKGSIADQSYAVNDANAPLTMQGQAWVYRNLPDAMTALTSNAIDNGVIVLQNCVGQDVSLLALTIKAMDKAAEIALITDGYCSQTDVLTIAHITPNAYANQDFANIQNGDVIEIDVAKGRLNINVSSKDMKIRAKRNIMKENEIYF